MKKDSSKLILTISVILLLIIAITLVVTLNKYGVITGRATDTGTANLTIEAEASISFSDADCDFGSGSVIEDAGSAILYSNGSDNINGTWTNQSCNGLTVQNDGNVNVTLNLTSGKDADDFIGGAAATNSFKWIMSEGEAGSCAGTFSVNDTFTEITISPTVICTDFLYNDSKDTINIDFELIIPEDALGTKGVIITATGTAL